MRRFTTMTAVALVCGISSAVMAAEQKVDVVREDRVELSNWNYDDLYASGNWSVDRLLDNDVEDVNGEDLGEIENVIFNTDGKVEAVVAEVGGFLDIGDNHLRVPWSEVELRYEGDDQVIVLPINEDNIEDYDAFAAASSDFVEVDEDNEWQPRGWGARELLNDYVTLDDGVRYGLVEDIIIAQNGAAKAVVVDAGVGTVRGRYAYPYYGYAWGFRPDRPYYTMPYTEAEVADMEPFDYSKFEPRRVN